MIAPRSPWRREPGESVSRDQGDHAPAVVAWRDYWLAPSETFIRDQVRGLTRWRAICVGRRRYRDPLLEPHFAPFSDAISGRVAGRLPASRSTRRRFQAIVDDPAVGLVHAHFGPDGLTALPFAASAGKPLIVSFYGMDVFSLPFRRGPAARRYRLLLPHLFDRAHTLIAPSHFLAAELHRLGAPASKIRINAPGTRVPPPPPRRPRSGVIFVGRLVAKKGAADLLAAMARLPEPLRSVRITVVGYGPQLAALRSAADRLSLDVRFLGRQSSSRIAELLGEHAVFCGPSRRAADGDAESLGMVFVEAALAGLPVASYRHGGVPEAVADGCTGLLAAEGDVAGLATNLRRLLTDSALAATLGDNGYARAAALFDLGTRTGQLETLYDAVIESAAPRLHPSRHAADGLSRPVNPR